MKVWIVRDWENETEVTFNSSVEAYKYCFRVLTQIKTSDDKVWTSFFVELINSYLTNKDLFGVEDILEVGTKVLISF